MNIPEKQAIPLEKEVFLKMTQCNPGVTIEDISKSYSGNRFQYFTDGLSANLKKRKPLIDISPLAYLQNLEEITLFNCAITDISPLKDFIHLHKLNLTGTKIRDISPLKDLVHLQELKLIGTKVRDVSPLKDLVQLRELDLRGTKVKDISPLKDLIYLNYLNIYDTLVTDISAFKERKDILRAKRKQLGPRVKKSPAEMKKAIEQIKEKIEELGIKPRPTLQYEQIEEFERGAKIKLPKEYTLFLTEVGDGFETELYIEKIIPFSEANFNPEDIAKKFNFQNAWIWEDDKRLDSRYHSIGNGQLHLMNNGCGYYYNLIVCGRAKGEVWQMTDVGMCPYKYGIDFLDWIWDFLNDKLIIG